MVVLTILKNMSSSMGRIIPYIMENKKCLKPPIIYIYTLLYTYIHTYIYIYMYIYLAVIRESWVTL